jgi:flagellar motility protein MotE (MotC chaperone)
MKRELGEYRSLVNEIQAGLPIRPKSLQDIPQVVKQLARDRAVRQKVFERLGLDDNGDVEHVLDDVLEKTRLIDAISAVLRPGSLQQLPAVIQKMKVEQEQVRQLLETTGDVNEAIANLKTRQTDFDTQLRLAGDFLSKIFDLITGPSVNPVKLGFPLKQSVQDRLIEVLTKMKDQARTDHEKIDHLFQQAKSMGYDGDDPIEACKYIADRLAQTQQQKTFETVQQELAAVQAAQKREEELHESAIAKLKKQLADLKGTVAQQQEVGVQREDELRGALSDLERKNRQLAEQLEEAGRIRQELGRIGAGFSADSKYLRSKMSANELRLLDFVEKMMRQEKDSKQVLQQQRAVREALLGDAAHVTPETDT